MRICSLKESLKKLEYSLITTNRAGPEIPPEIGVNPEGQFAVRGTYSDAALDVPLTWTCTKAHGTAISALALPTAPTPATPRATTARSKRIVRLIESLL